MNPIRTACRQAQSELPIEERCPFLEKCKAEKDKRPNDCLYMDDMVSKIDQLEVSNKGLRDKQRRFEESLLVVDQERIWYKEHRGKFNG